MRETDRTKAKTKPTTTQERKEKGRRAKKKPNKASRQRMFDKAADCSDAESKVGLRLIGVPLWENQHVRTNELIGQDLVGHEIQGKHP